MNSYHKIIRETKLLLVLVLILAGFIVSGYTPSKITTAPASLKTSKDLNKLKEIPEMKDILDPSDQEKR